MIYQETETSNRPQRPIGYQIGLLALLLAYLALMVLAWNGGFYQEAARHLGVPAFETLFLDIVGPLSWLECARQGIDVFTTNPCDIANRIYNYGHGWLILMGTGLSTADTVWAGALTSSVFLFGIVALLRPMDLGQALYCALIVVAPAIMFAAERANVDIVIFLLVLAAAGLLSMGLVGRLLGYVVLFFCGLLKFFPFFALGLALRERTKVFFAVTAISAIGVAIYIGLYGSEIWTVFGNMPWTSHPIEFTTRGLAKSIAAMWHLVFGWEPDRRGLWYDIVRLLLPLAGIWLSFRSFKWLRRSGFCIKASKTEMTLFLLGCVIICFCFFTGRNFSYRAIFLVLCVPALLTALGGVDNDDNRQTKKIGWTILVLLAFSLWSSAVFYNLQAIGDVIGDFAYIVIWVLAEVLNWALVVLLAAFIWDLAARSPAWGALVRSGKFADR
ncbi:MAG: hypothetical protein GY791_07550 [Alphaproteobacteria bacterium]|nr:hypothetical protein [Alphaproteobacteria bacterium]